MNAQYSEGRTFDLEERTFRFARDVRAFVKTLPRTVCNQEDVKQVVRSSGSVGANYIEANEALSKKDFLHRIRISRKESKETTYWLKLLDTQDRTDLNTKREKLIQESTDVNENPRCHPKKIRSISFENSLFEI